MAEKRRKNTKIKWGGRWWSPVRVERQEVVASGCSEQRRGGLVWRR